MPDLDDSALDVVRYSPVCAHCARLTSGIERTCEAFTERIPDAIWSGKDKHRSPVKGDGGKTYKPKG